MKLEYHKSCVLEEEDGLSNDSAITHHSPSAPMSVYKATSNHHLAGEPAAQSLINFKANNGGESLLSFQQKEYYLWENNGLHQWNYQISPRSNSDPTRVIQDFNCIQTTSSGYGSGSSKEKQQGESSSSSYGWLYSEPNIPSDSNSLHHDSSPTEKEASSNKRLSMGERLQASKKQCTAASKTPKPTKSSNPSKDPQSIAAKNRRERISERLKILQELVPNGSKVDLVTMLEKAISYVKFLQLQVKVLATDEFWPVQGGKAPDISQVKEAIDAILSSQRDRNSTSKQQK
ncbi:hypothetical protein QN277_015885 [Acacia crassicarpa]|uniref:BHLH domain-containing protein n=1 Tax=Acacia crassicarpa TaxID=499986 RepID=A0AAE1MRM2_9FABA|nr:hypothetical protein QN277_015885 [Acacia crassicarpa]